ncbi:ABC transporter ATP-binding protein/permease [Methylomonas sp. SURF-1]|uniref:ABC transporter ATP-binding protein/permease n=1 Tax=Methylomonas aurea TaxID=2952224 RepID=A0ABT1UDC1_9GAMM|nr:ABC transporter ATP-binding protein [Methylomonas sp. SURF-1]MCQ8180233.1 ABC transporter ATP-binding protein/permease [Methylomonas sp. SURF-1]
MRFLMLVFRIIPEDWHRRFFGLVALYLLLGVFEMLGVASIMPFVALLSDPSALAKSSTGQLFALVSPVPLEQIPVHVVGLVVLFLFVFGNVLGLASMWLSIRFSARLGVRLAGELSLSFFARGLPFLRSQNPTIHANYVVREIDRAVSGGILQLCLIVSKTFQVALVVVLLALVSPLFSAVFGLAAIVMYSLFFRVLRKKMAGAGEAILHATGNATRAATDLFASAKEVLVRGNLNYFVGGVCGWLDEYHHADQVSRVYPMIPKYLIELLAFSMLLSLPIYRSWSGGEYRSLVPFIALFAYAGYRLLPNLQQVYASLSILKFNAAAVEYLGQCLAEARARTAGVTRIERFDRSMVFENVAYTYPGSDSPALAGVSLQIAAGEKVAIVGVSGSGKSTLLDLILGLVPAASGTIAIDGIELADQRLSWATELVGYAPQAPLILGASVAENIAFGIPADAIDQPRCREVADFALAGDVVGNLPRGMATVLGSGGVALSGGEAQRISIARALYHDPQIVVLDEPSSALDPILSARLFEKLCAIGFRKTVVAVTHNWDVLPGFDKVVLMDAGRLAAIGSYAEVAPLVEELRKREPAEV